MTLLLLEGLVGAHRAISHAHIQPTPQAPQSILEPVAPGSSQAKPRTSPGAPNPNGFEGPSSFSQGNFIGGKFLERKWQGAGDTESP